MEGERNVRAVSVERVEGERNVRAVSVECVEGERNVRAVSVECVVCVAMSEKCWKCMESVERVAAPKRSEAEFGAKMHGERGVRGVRGHERKVLEVHGARGVRGRAET